MIEWVKMISTYTIPLNCFIIFFITEVWLLGARFMASSAAIYTIHMDLHTLDSVDLIENRRLLQDRGILSRIFETAATARRQVGVMMVHER